MLKRHGSRYNNKRDGMSIISVVALTMLQFLKNIFIIGLEIKINKFFQAELAKTIKECLERNQEDKAIQLICKLEDALRWRDVGHYNFTLIHHAMKENCEKFISTILKNEKVLYIL